MAAIMPKSTETRLVAFYLKAGSNQPVTAYPVAEVVRVDGDFMAAINSDGLAVLTVPRDNILYFAQAVMEPENDS